MIGNLYWIVIHFWWFVPQTHCSNDNDANPRLSRHSFGGGTRASRVRVLFPYKFVGKTVQRFSQGPQAAAYVRGWGRRHKQVDFLPVPLLALITRTAGVTADSLPLLAEPLQPKTRWGLCAAR